MKRYYIRCFLLTLVSIIPTINANSQKVDYMNVYLLSQASFQSIAIDEIDKITFPSGDEVNITLSGTVIPIAMDNIEFITFGDTDITAIEKSETKGAEIEINYYGGEVRIISPIAINHIQLYNIQGVLIQLHTPNAETAILNIDNYPTGIYIVAVQSGGEIVTNKIIKN